MNKSKVTRKDVSLRPHGIWLFIEMAFKTLKELMKYTYVITYY